jgi:hypothetical protein
LKKGVLDGVRLKSVLDIKELVLREVLLPRMLITGLLSLSARGLTREKFLVIPF